MARSTHTALGASHPSVAVRERDPERKPDVANLALADRISSAGALAAGIAHELNNPLAYVSANLAFLADAASRVVEILAGASPASGDTVLAAQLHDAMREAKTGADRMRAVVRDLKIFAGSDHVRNMPVDLVPVLESCLNVAWGEIRGRARLARNLAPIQHVVGNEARLGQLFLNLIVNAAQSIPAGNPDEHEVGVATRMLPDGCVSVEVSDTGCGITDSDLPRIFDPFFTTKPPGVGTGLGLSICHAVVAALGGTIEVTTELGRGSTFRVLLPAAPRPSGASVSPIGLPPRGDSRRAV